MKRRFPLRVLVLVLAVAQIAAAFWPQATGLGQSVAVRSEEMRSAATPAVYAFAIWGLIYLLCLVFAAYQLAARREDHLLDDIRGPAAIAFAVNTAWEIWVPMQGIEWGSLTLIGVGLIACLAAMARLKRARTGLLSRDGLLVKAPLALLAGWVSVAAFVNAAPVVETFAPDPLGLGPSLETAAFVAAAAGAAAMVITSQRTHIAYAAAVVWGLVAIAVSNQMAFGDFRVFITAAVGALVVAVVGVLSTMRPDEARGWLPR